MNGTRGLVIATAAAFIVGCSVGIVGGILVVHVVMPRAAMHLMPGPPRFPGHRGPALRSGPDGPERWMPRLERALDLTPEQHARIVAMLDRARQGQAAVHESLQVQIVRVLTPEQRARWREMELRFERSRRGRWSRGPMPPDRP